MGTIIDGDRQDKFDVSIGELEKMLGGDLPTGQPDDKQKIAALDSVDWDHLLQEANPGPAAGAPQAGEGGPAPERHGESPRLAASATPSAPFPADAGGDIAEPDFSMAPAGPAPRETPLPDPPPTSPEEPVLLPDDQLQALLASLDSTLPEAGAPAAASPEQLLSAGPEPVPAPLDELPPEPVVESVTTLPDPEVPSDDDLRSLLSSLGVDGDEADGAGETAPPPVAGSAVMDPDDDAPPAWGAAEAQLPEETPGPNGTDDRELLQMDQLLAGIPALPEAVANADVLPAPAEMAAPPLAKIKAETVPADEVPPEETGRRQPAPEAPAVPEAAHRARSAGEEIPDAFAAMPAALAMPIGHADRDDRITARPAVTNGSPVRLVPDGPGKSVPPPAPVNLPPEKQVIACLKAGMYRESVPILKSLIAAAPENADHYFNLSVACQRLHDAAGAQAALERCLEIDGGFYRALCNLAGMFYKQGDLAGAQELLERAVGINPFDSHSAYNLKLVRRKRSGKAREKKLIQR